MGYSQDESRYHNSSKEATLEKKQSQGVIIMEERIYTIPLRDVKRVPRWKRAKKAVSSIKEYLIRHTKSENILLDKSINEKVWERGAEKPPSKIRVRVFDEEGVTRAELVKEA